MLAKALRKIFRPEEKPYTLPVTAIILAIIVYILEEEFLSKPLMRFYIDLLAYPTNWREPYLAIATTIFSFCLLICFIWTIFVSTRLIKIGLITFFSLTLLFEYSYQKTIGRYLLPADIIMGLRAGTSNWIDAIQLYFDWRSLLGAGFFILLFMVLPSKPDFRKSLFGILVLLLGIALINLTPVRFRKNINWGTSPVQFPSVLYRYALDELFPQQRELLSFHANTVPQNNIVLIIDESVGGDYLNVNGFPRETTPYLAQLATQERIFHNWGITVSSATCSDSANTLIITGARIEPYSKENAYRFPTIYQYAKAMGYTTYYIDAQMSVLWAGISDKDLQFIDHWVKASDLSRNNQIRDFFAADQIRQITDSSTGNLIVLNKNGIHYFYQKNYPRDQAIWLPIPTNVEGYQEPDLILNDYSNAIRLNVDNFFAHLFPNPDKLFEYTKNTYYFYTSDHSQTLFQQGTTSLHCTNSYLGARVPLIVFGQFAQKPDTTYLASHSNLLPTILELMAVPNEQIPTTFNLSLLKAKKSDSVDRLYFAGNSNEIYNQDKLEREHPK